jgi:endogenous inhibitor of DNA gyrase (YacG/DUF329 family)
MKIKCSICGKRVDYENNPWKPFCSKECKLVDLWNWFHKKYSLKIEEIEEKINTMEEEKDDTTNSMWCSRKNGQ